MEGFRAGKPSNEDINDEGSHNWLPFFKTSLIEGKSLNFSILNFTEGYEEYATRRRKSGRSAIQHICPFWRVLLH